MTRPGGKSRPNYDVETVLDPGVLTERFDDTTTIPQLRGNNTRVRSQSWNELATTQTENRPVRPTNTQDVEKVTLQNINYSAGAKIGYVLIAFTFLSMVMSGIAIFLALRPNRPAVAPDVLGKYSSEDIEQLFALVGDIKNVLAQLRAKNETTGDSNHQIATKLINVDKLNISDSQLNGGWIAKNTLPYDRIKRDTIPDFEITNIADESITGNFLAPDSVDDSKISSVSAKKISGNIEGSQISDKSITSGKIANVEATQISGEIPLSQIPEIPDDKIKSVSASKIIGTAPCTQSCLSNIVVTDSMLASGINGAKIEDRTIHGGKIADGSISFRHIQDGSISNSMLQEGISAEKLTGTIPAHSIPENSISDSKLQWNISGQKIAAGTISGLQLAHNTIDSSKIAAGAVGSAHIAANAVTDQKILGMSATKLTDTILDAQLASGISGSKIAVGTITLAHLSFKMAYCSISANGALGPKCVNIPSVSITSTGVFTVSFSAGFSSAPFVQITMITFNPDSVTGCAIYGTVTTANAIVACRNPTSGPANLPFTIFAIGA